jgi:excisionase family DNA binding protein
MMLLMADSTRDGDEYLSVKDICRELKISHQTVRKWLLSGRLPYIRAGRNYRILRSDLQRLIAENTTANAIAPLPAEQANPLRPGAALHEGFRH